MSSRVKKLRKFLEKNKIFFEIGLAIIVAFTGIYISIQANDIAKNQTKIMELENTPKIEIRKTQIYNDSLKIYDLTKWFVFNHNSKISNFEIDQEISYLNFTKRKNYEEISIPLRSYLNIGGTLSGENEGLIFEFDNKYSGYNEFLTRQGIRDHGYLDTKSFISLSYDDILEKREIKYFQITPLIKEISKKSWDSLISDWSGKSMNAIILDSDIKKNIEEIKKCK